MELLKTVLRNGGGCKTFFKFSVLLVSILFSLLITSCAGGAGGGGSGAEETALSVTFPQTMATYTATDLASYSVTIESSKYTATKSGPAGGTITFTNIPVGTYKVTAYGKKADGTIAAKNNPNETSVTIEEGKTKTTVIRLHLLDYFTVTFKSGYDNSVIGTQQVISGEKATKPSNPASPTAELYFVNWYSNNDYTEIFNFNTAINADIEVYAKFDDIPYTVTLNYNGGKDASNNTSSSDTYSYNDHVNVPETITKTGYTRLGWATTADAPIEDVIISIPDVTGDATYYAIWGLATYDITYQGVSTYGSQGASSPSSYTYGTPVTISNAVGTNCTFAGWYTDANFTTAFTGITATTTGDITLYAKFTATLTIYKEKFETSWGDLVDTQTVTCGKTATALTTAPTKTGAGISGWQYGQDGEEQSFTFGTDGTVISRNMTIWATWVTNSITYHNVGTTEKGRMASSAAMTYTTGTAFTLPTPVMNDTDYVFDGWYESSNFSGAKVTSIPATESGAKNYYAKFLFGASYIICDVDDFSNIEFTSDLTSITWEVDSETDLSAIVNAIAAKGIDVNLNLASCSISTIGEGAFSSISGYLTGITIPASVNSIGKGAFYGCSKLATLTDAGSGTWSVVSQSGGAHELDYSISAYLNTLKTSNINAYSRE